MNKFYILHKSAFSGLIIKNKFVDQTYYLILILLNKMKLKGIIILCNNRKSTVSDVSGGIVDQPPTDGKFFLFCFYKRKYVKKVR